MTARRRTARRPKRSRRSKASRPRRLDHRVNVASLAQELEAQREEVAAKTRQLEQAHLELEQALAYSSDLYDSAPVAYLTIDPYGLVIDANAASFNLFGLERERLVGRSLLRLVAEADRLGFLEHMRQCRDEGSARTQLTLIGRDRPFPAEVDSRRSDTPLDPRPRFRTALSDLRDVHNIETERRRADHERHKAEASEQSARVAYDARDRFLAELSHELRTPLTPVLAAVTGLLTGSDLPESLKPTIEMIRRNVNIEAKLIADLLDVSRIASSQLQVDRTTVIDAHQVARETVADLEPEIRSHGVGFDLELNARESWLAADAVRLRQILANLLANALDATPPGGRVTLSSANMGTDLRFIVRDTGVGIEPSKLDDIFLPFTQAEKRPVKAPRLGLGLGLGLAIVKGLVEAHGGRIAAFSEGVGKGARLVVEIPYVPKDVRSEEPPPPEISGNGEGRRHGKSKRILLVEDDTDTAAVLKKFLELEGYDVQLAHDVATAAELARDSVDVLVCDIGLPDGTGFDLMRRISAERPIKAIALTGYGSPRDVDVAASVGFAMHLTKPVTVEALVAAIESVGESTVEAESSAPSTPAAR